MAQFAVKVEGIERIREIQNLRGRTNLVLVRAINKVARDARVKASREIREQINFPARLLAPSSGNLSVTKQANQLNLEARITARSRPTSLARFSKTTPRSKGILVEVKPGHARFLKRAFFIRLRQGSQLTETKFNLGLAIRLRPGESLANKKKQIRSSRGLYLLYGPSIQQVFLDNRGKGVADDLTEPTADALEAEVIRLLSLRD